MSITDMVDVGFATRIETDSEYVLREATIWLQNRAYEFWNEQDQWYYTHQGTKGNYHESKELAVLSAFVHHVHHVHHRPRSC